MLPEGLIPVTTTCGPAPNESATFSAQAGMEMPVELQDSLMRCSSWVRKRTAGRDSLAGRLDVHDLVLRRAARGGDRDLLPHLPLQDGLAHRGGVAQFPARGIRLVGADDLERPLLPLLPDDPQRHGGTKIHRVFLDLRGVDNP